MQRHTRSGIVVAAAAAAGRHRTCRAPTTRRARPLAPTAPSGAAAQPERSSRSTRRPLVLAGAMALIIIVGATTGARIKTDSDSAREHRAYQELTIEQRIAMLEDRRSVLVSRKMSLEKKLAEYRARVAAARRRAVDDGDDDDDDDDAGPRAEDGGRRGLI